MKLAENWFASGEVERFAGGFFRERSRPDVVEWCRRELRLADRESAYYGPWSDANCPYVREPLRAMCDGPTRVVVLPWPTQVFKTTLMMAAAAYCLANDPGPLLWVFDSADNARDFVAKRWRPTVAGSPGTRELMPAGKREWKSLSQSFANASYYFTGSNSLGKVSSKPIRFVWIDELEKFAAVLKGEAGSLDQARERTKSYPDYKHVLSSSPGMETGLIWKEALEGSREWFFVPSPRSGDLMALSFSMLKWDQGARDRSGVWDEEVVQRSAYLVCPFTGEPIWDSEKTAMLDEGTWVPLREAAVRDDLAPYRRSAFGGWVEREVERMRARKVRRDPDRRSFHLNAFYSQHANCRWGLIARKFLESKRDLSKKMIFVNGWLGEPTEVDVEELAAEALLDRREVYLQGARDGLPVLPDGAVLLTCGVDVQEGGERSGPPRLVYEVVGHGLNNESWGVLAGEIVGRLKDEETRRELDKLLARRWAHPAGSTMGITCAAIDTGHDTADVYDYVEPREARRVWGVKGFEGRRGDPFVSRARRPTVQKIDLFLVSRFATNDFVMGSLRVERPGPGFAHFPMEASGAPACGYDARWFDQLTAAALQRTYKEGFEVAKWVKLRADDALACRRYAFAALRILNADLASVQRMVQGELGLGAAAPGKVDEARQEEPALENRRRRRGWGGFVGRF